MPELPEVETIRRELATELPGRRVTDLRVHRPDILMDGEPPAAFAGAVRGRRIRSVERRAKYLLLRLTGEEGGAHGRGAAGGRVLQVQLRMTGRFVLGRSRPDPSEFGHLAAELELDDGRTLFYDDVRRLGGFRLLDPAEWARESDALGPEPLEPDFDVPRLRRALSGRRAPVKNVLLDQRRVAGIGNIYAAEALHRAGVDPRRPGGSLEPEEGRRLHRALREVLGEALEAAGTTFRDYRAVNGRSGRFQDRLAVYGREGRPCPRCGGDVRRVVQAGRSTFFCPGCQS